MSSEVQYRTDKCPCTQPHQFRTPWSILVMYKEWTLNLAPTISIMLRFSRVFLWNILLALKIDHSHSYGCPYTVHFHVQVSLCLQAYRVTKLCAWLYVRSSTKYNLGGTRNRCLVRCDAAWFDSYRANHGSHISQHSLCSDLSCLSKEVYYFVRIC
jgi:hypothetical protein